MNMKLILKRIFIREPTLWFAIVAGVINLITTYKLDFLSPEQAALWITFFSAIFGAGAAWRTRPIAPQVFTYLVSSVVALVAAYGANSTQEQIGQWNILALAIAALITRNQVSPKETAHLTGVEGERITETP